LTAGQGALPRRADPAGPPERLHRERAGDRVADEV